MSDQAEVEQSVEDRMASLLGEEDSDEVIDQEDGAIDSEPAEVESEEESEDSDEQPAEPQRIKLKRGDEEVEVDIEEAKNLAQMGYDYTKKTQEVADQRKQVEAQAQAIKAQEQILQQQAQLQQAFIKEIAKVESINEQLSQYEKIDWQSLTDNDPVQAQKYWIAYQQLQNSRTQVQNEIHQKQQMLQQQQAQQHAARLAEAKAELLKAFPGWNAEKALELREAGKHYGFTEEELGGVTDPRTVKLLADAAAYRKLQASKGNVTQKVTNKPAVVKPGSRDSKTVARSQNHEARRELKRTGNAELAAKLIERML